MKSTGSKIALLWPIATPRGNAIISEAVLMEVIRRAEAWAGGMGLGGAWGLGGALSTGWGWGHRSPCNRLDRVE